MLSHSANQSRIDWRGINDAGCNFTRRTGAICPHVCSCPACSSNHPYPPKTSVESPVKSVGADTLNALAERGMRHLFMRHFVTTAVTLAGGALLARALSPAEFGTYAIAAFIVNIFMIFGDLGLGAAFIQRGTAPSHRDLQLSFTVQFCLITAVVLLTWGLAPWIIRFYPAMTQNGLWLVRVLSLLLYIPVFRSISAVQLERSMNFRPIAWAEGTGICIYQVVAAACALNGLGIWSFVLATFAAGFTWGASLIDG